MTNKDKNELMEWISSIAIAFILALLIRVFVFEFIKIDKYSMLPTLHDRDWVVMEKISYRFHGPERGDIVILQNPGNLTENYVKRVVGLEGDKIEIRNGYVFLNDEKQIEPYVKETVWEDYGPVQVPEDTIFVMGDNRNFSKDSRDPTVGFIPRQNVRGKVIFRIWPINRLGLLGG